MSGPQRNPDKLNSIGIVVVGICGAVLVYVSIVALQAFYLNDSSDVQMMADYGGQDIAHKSLRAQQLDNLQRFEPKAAATPPAPQTYTISIDDAIKLVARDAKKDPSNLVPANGPAVTPSVKPIYGRPRPLVEPPGAGAPAPAGTGTPAPAGAAPAGPAGAGSSAPMTPTGGLGPGGGPPPGSEGKADAATVQPPAPPKATPAPAQPKATPAQPKATPAQPKAAPAQPKATPAQPKATPAQPKGGAAPKQPATGQPKKGNAS